MTDAARLVGFCMVLLELSGFVASETRWVSVCQMEMLAVRRLRIHKRISKRLNSRSWNPDVRNPDDKHALTGSIRQPRRSPRPIPTAKQHKKP